MLDLFKEIADNVENEIKKFTDKKELCKITKIGAYNEPTAFIDEIAEKIAIKTIQEYDKKLNILSEEIGFIDNDGKETIVLDPIDGTFNALHKIPYYSISIAIGNKKLSDVRLAFVKNLATKEIFHAEYKKGAYQNENRIYVNKNIKEKLNISIYFGKNVPEKAIDIVRKTKHVRFFGCASLELCLVANGTLDMYHQVGYPLRVVDIAAGALILRESGGEIYNENREILDMNFNLAERANIIAVCDKKILELI